MGPGELADALRRVAAGVYSRLAARYVRSHTAADARALALLMTGLLMGLRPADIAGSVSGVDQARLEDTLREEVDRLASDREIRRMVTDAAVIAVVCAMRGKGCSSGAHSRALDFLRETGLYLPAERPPTPLEFVRAARAFHERIQQEGAPG